MLPFIRFSIVAALVTLISCEKGHLEIYEEPITSMSLVFQPDSEQVVVLSYLDSDGIGGLRAIQNDVILNSNTTYNCELIINNQTPLALPRLLHVIDSGSVTNRPELHQVFYESDSQLQLKTTYRDQDINGNPVGFMTTIETGGLSRGKLVVSVIHAPNKTASDVASGKPARAGGTLDLRVEFDIQIAYE